MTKGLDDLDVCMTATSGGRKTNRIVIRKAKKRVPTRIAPATYKPNRGKPYKIIGISCYVEDLAAIDAKAASLNISRSEFIRVACGQFGAA